MKKKLEWKNLKDGFCPSCYQELDEHETSWHCPSCPFNISKTRFNEVLYDMKKDGEALEE